MSVTNQVNTLESAFLKDAYTIPLRKRRLLGNNKDTNHRISKIPVVRGCYNCTHELSRYFYWKPNPCDKCTRSPSNSYWSLRAELTDNWERLIQTSFSGRNTLQ